ncbi:MAG: AIM24 family protein [Phycisphaerales bacterium]
MAKRAKSHTFEYEIVGELLQAAVVTLEPGASIVGAPGAMLFMESGITMDTGLTTHTEDPGVVGSVVEAAKRKIAGDAFFVTRFVNESKKRAQLSFAAPYPGQVVDFELDELPEGIVLQRAAFLCGSRDVDFEIVFQKRVLAGIFGGEGFILQRVTSKQAGSLALAHACGSILQRELGKKDSLRVDTGCLVAYEPSVQFDVELVSGVKNMVLGAHGPFLATLNGPGRVWLQTMPFTRLASRVWEAAPQSAQVGKGDGKEESGIVGRVWKRATGSDKKG